MTEFNKYASALNTIALSAFADYRAAERAVLEAKAAMDDFPRHDNMSAQYAFKVNQAEYEYQAASENLKKAKKAMRNCTKEIADIRSELAAEIEKRFSVDPAAVDNNAISLLQSGVMNSTDYMRMMQEAENTGNHTMMRLIADHAKKAAEAAERKNGAYDPEAVALRSVSQNGAGDGNEILQQFDALTFAYERTASNPAMIDHWTEITGETIEAF